MFLFYVNVGIAKLMISVLSVAPKIGFSLPWGSFAGLLPFRTQKSPLLQHKTRRFLLKTEADMIEFVPLQTNP